MELSWYPVLPFLNDSLLTVSLLSLLLELRLNLSEPLHFVISLRKLLDRVLILLLEERLKVLARELSVLELIDLDLGKVNDLGRESVAEDLIVHVVRPTRADMLEVYFLGMANMLRCDT